MIREYIIKVDESKPDITGGVPLTEPAKELVRCKDCKHRPPEPNWETYESGFDLKFPDNECPCQCSGDDWYSWYPSDDWFCPKGEHT